ncbi:hypothetical protein HHI36_017702 [Cryptolaemus montrouzieri]|uniref:Uncharacterized protein n=1 Tax=Cryptolaemus montrouzieri TaxID=559131 RepID=A0ABD2NNZ6_9CUCU
MHTIFYYNFCRKNSEISIPASTTTQIAETSAELSIPDSSITTVDADTPAELSIPSTSTTTQAAGISTDEPKTSCNIHDEDDLDTFHDHFEADGENNDDNVPLQICFICEKHVNDVRDVKFLWQLIEKKQLIC